MPCSLFSFFFGSRSKSSSSGKRSDKTSAMPPQKSTPFPAAPRPVDINVTVTTALCCIHYSIPTYTIYAPYSMHTCELMSDDNDTITFIYAFVHSSI